MTVEVAGHAGFCMGVQRAVSAAESAAEEFLRRSPRQKKVLNAEDPFPDEEAEEEERSPRAGKQDRKHPVLRVLVKAFITLGLLVCVGSFIFYRIVPNYTFLVIPENLISRIAERFSAPGIGKWQGANFNLNNSFFKGIYMAPAAVANALKTAVFAAYLLEKLGYENVSPRYDDYRTDIIQTVELGSREALVNFTQGIQSSSPIDSYVRVLPAPMPGYPFEEVMAAGCFTQGSTIELSADAPVIKPYTLYLQGSLTQQYGRISILAALNRISQS